MSGQQREFTKSEIADLYYMAKYLVAHEPDCIIFSYPYDDRDLDCTVQIPVTAKEMLENIEKRMDYDYFIRTS